MVMDLIAPIVSKSNDELRIATAPVLVPGEKDLVGDNVTKNQVREYAYDYMENYRIVDANHTVKSVAVPVESWLTRQPMTVKTVDGLELELPTATWMMTAKVKDQKEWEGVKNGRYKGFSIMAIRKNAEGEALKVVLATNKGLAVKSKAGQNTLEDLDYDVFVPAVSLASNPAVPKSKYIAIKDKVQAVQDGLVKAGQVLKEIPDFPVAEPGREWKAKDAVGAGGRVRQKITNEGQDGPEDWTAEQWAQYRKAHLWYNEEEPEKLTSYKLPFVDVVEGEYTIIPRAVTTAAGILQGSEGVEIPETDIGDIKARVEPLYDRIAEENDREDFKPPWVGKSTEIKFDAAMKVGRTISQANLKKLQNVVENIEAAAEQVNDLIETAFSERQDDDPEDRKVNITFREVSPEMDGKELETTLKSLTEATESISGKIEAVKEELGEGEELTEQMENLEGQIEEVRELAEKAVNGDGDDGDDDGKVDRVEKEVADIKDSMASMEDTVNKLKDALVSSKSIDGQDPGDDGKDDDTRKSYKSMGRDAFGRKRK